MTKNFRAWTAGALLMALTCSRAAHAAGTVGNTLPADFPVIEDYFSLQDGPFFPPVPAEDSFGQPTDFSRSATLHGARQLDLIGQGAFDTILHSAHLGILNSPQSRAAALEFLTARQPRH